VRRFIAAVLLTVGLVLAGLAYSCYSEYATASNLARFYRSHPGEVPEGVSREQYVADRLTAAERNRNRATLSGTGSLLLCVAGAALLILGGRRGAFSASAAGGSDEDPARCAEEMNRWAGAALSRPVTVHFKRLYALLYVNVMLFFVGVSALVIVASGFTSVSVLMLILNGMLLFVFYYLQGRAQRRTAYCFDLVGVTRGDRRRLNWSDFKSVDYLTAVRTHSGREFLWRVELVFNGGEAWIIPQRVANMDEIDNLLASLPGARQKRRA
jgi:hypothetical protein